MMAATIAYQDIQTRWISVFLLIGLFMLNSWEAYCTNGWEFTLQLIGVNTLLVSTIFGITYLYFKWIRKVEHPLVTHIGWGDILFFLALTPLYFPIVYSLVFIGITVVATIIGLLMIQHKETFTIPYAGIGAIVFIVLTVLEWGGIIHLNTLWI